MSGIPPRPRDRHDSASSSPASPSAALTLRPLTSEDAATVAHLERMVFPEDPWPPTMVDDELAAPLRHYVGAVVGGEVVGYGGIRLGPDADIMTIGVQEAHRGRGIGRAVLDDLLDAARQASTERVFLEVRATNDAAIRLYEHAGFHRIGRVRGYFRHPTEDAVTMRLDLPRGEPLR